MDRGHNGFCGCRTDSRSVVFCLRCKRPGPCPRRLRMARERDMMRKIIREPNGSGIFEPGQDLVVAGAIGKRGVGLALRERKAELSARFSEEFLQTVREQTEEKLDLTPELLARCGATEWEYVGEGGVLAALWILSGAYMRGISFSLTKIPVRQEMIEVCELFDMNPYRLDSGECVLAAADNGGDLVSALSERGIMAAVIGKAEKGIARKITGNGGTGYLERPRLYEREDPNEGKDSGDH